MCFEYCGQRYKTIINILPNKEITAFSKLKADDTLDITQNIRLFYFMLSSRISRNIGENIFRSYTGSTSENTDFHFLVA